MVPKIVTWYYIWGQEVVDYTVIFLLNDKHLQWIKLSPMCRLKKIPFRIKTSK